MEEGRDFIKRWLDIKGFIRCYEEEGGEIEQYIKYGNVLLWVNWKIGTFRFTWSNGSSEIESEETPKLYDRRYLDRTYLSFIREVRRYGGKG